MLSIDIHHHFQPTLQDSEGRPWSAASTLDELDRNGITAAICSLPPVRGTGSDDGRGKAREWNEWSTRICQDHPNRLGLFAALPLRDVDAALAELAYVYDVLGADGIGLPTNDGDVWLSDERFIPMYAEMNRRKSVVFLHPYPTSRCVELGHAYGGKLISAPWLEFPTNTARTILGLFTHGITRKFPDIRFIFCHGGGTMPALLGRIAGFDGWDTIGPDTLKKTFPDGIHEDFARLYFDCAQAYSPEMFALLQRLVPPGHLLFGSDHSYFPVAHSVAQLARLNLPADVHSAIAGRNAAALFPRFDSAG